jgi:hypothetical protein
MSSKVAEIGGLVQQDSAAAWVTQLWTKYNDARQGKVKDWEELRNYVFATDTTTTHNSKLPWKNTTTLPKLCQIRDNLHANYLSALFPNDNWLQWQGYTVDDSLKEKAKLIESYMSNKTRIGGFRTTMSKLLYDYIDYGVAFSVPDFKAKYKTMPDGTTVPDFIGPVARRISPLDIVFNPIADSFEESHKIVRSIKTLGEIKKMAMEEPENMFWEEALKNRFAIRESIGGYSVEDFNKAVAFDVDGFGNMYEYFQSDYIEILEFYGDYYNKDTGELQLDRIVTVADRSIEVRNVPMPQWYCGSPISYVGWRERPDNLWSMGPLENLVGLQYRLDHLENLKADAMDLLVHPPLKIIGEVEEFVWAPGVEINIDEGGSDVVELGKNTSGIFTANAEIQSIEDHMELYAGAPREAMGMRTPGEKTAFEVDQLSNAAGRIFQEKITHFEIELLEKLLNKMLETTQRNLDVTDVIRVMDEDIGAEVFQQLTAADITANGKIRPVGARHFSQKSQELRSLSDLFNTQLGQIVMPHTSAIEVTKFINDTLGLSGYKIFTPNVAVAEGEETAVRQGEAQDNVAMQLSPEMAV